MYYLKGHPFGAIRQNWLLTSIALGCDYFCTRDEAHGAGTSSVLGPVNLSWLESSYEFKAVKPEQLIAICRLIQ